MVLLPFRQFFVKSARILKLVIFQITLLRKYIYGHHYQQPQLV